MKLRNVESRKALYVYEEPSMMLFIYESGVKNSVYLHPSRRWFIIEKPSLVSLGESGHEGAA